MANTVKIIESVERQEIDFHGIVSQEQYQWITAKHFQNNWSIEYAGFADMLKWAFVKYIYLLDAGVMCLLANVALSKCDANPIRGRFKMHFDETLPLEQCFRSIQTVPIRLLPRCNKRRGLENIFLDHRAIRVYTVDLNTVSYFIVVTWGGFIYE